MIALDACTVVYAAKHYSGGGHDPLANKGSARLLAQRSTREFAVPESAAGELLLGSKSEREAAVICAYLRRFAILATTPRALRDAAALLRAFPERKSRKFRKDAVAYAIAAVRDARAFCTFDKGFIGRENHAKLKTRCRVAGVRYIPAHNALEMLVMPHVNPKPRRARRESVDAFRARADARARKYVGNDFMALMRFYSGVSRAYGLVPRA